MHGYAKRTESFHRSDFPLQPLDFIRVEIKAQTLRSNFFNGWLQRHSHQDSEALSLAEYPLQTRRCGLFTYQLLARDPPPPVSTTSIGVFFLSCVWRRQPVIFTLL
jgi:hypothetical protein